MKKRTWHYNQRPKIFEISPCECGNEDTEWSEYKDHLWCSKCQVDFTPKNWGIFDGPICINVCALLGIYFDRWNLETNNFEEFDLDTLEYKPVLEPQD